MTRPFLGMPQPSPGAVLIDGLSIRRLSTEFPTEDMETNSPLRNPVFEPPLITCPDNVRAGRRDIV